MTIQSQRSMGGPLSPAGYEQTDSPTIPEGTSVVIIVPVADIRWRDDGGTVDASTGMPIAAGQTFIYTGLPEALEISGTADLCYYR